MIEKILFLFEGAGTEMNATANLEGAGEEKKKRVIRNPQPKLNADRIMGPRGIQTLEQVFKVGEPSSITS